MDKQMAHSCGVNTFSYQWSHGAADCMRHLAAMGFDEFEFMTMPGHLWPDELDQAQRAALLRLMDELGVKGRSLNHTGLDQNLTSPIAEVRAYTVGVFRKLIALAKDLRIPTIVVVPGRLNPLLAAPIERHLDWLHDSICALTGAAEDSGVKLALENIPISPLRKVEDLHAMIARIGSPALRICYDVANAHYVDEDPATGLKAAAPLVDLVHLSDTTRRAWRHDALGDGDLDFAAALEALAEIRHARKPLLELAIANPDEGLRTSLRRIAQLRAVQP